MNLKTITFAVCALIGGQALSAQQVNISPQPQQIQWGEKAFDHPIGFKVKDSKTVDADALAALRKEFPADKGVRLVIGQRGDKAVSAVESKIPNNPQGYYLKVTPKEVIVAGNDATGTFYGVQSLLAVASAPEVMSVEIVDWPATPNRGVVEGFYGNAWSFADRVSQFEFYGRHKMDTYIYGPKDDPYHRGKWREYYPQAEAEKMKDLVKHATANKVKFVWGIHPAGDHSWQNDDNEATVRKFEQMYSFGVRNFAVFFDDVFGIHAEGKKHAEYMNYIMANFVKKHSDIETMIICPSLYNKNWVPRFQPSYLADISVMDPFIEIMWTGDKVVTMITKDQLEWVNPQIGRKAYIWHNYPVTDFCIDHLLMGPYEGNDNGAPALVNGFTANPMEYAEASKVSLVGTADYLWNPDAYDAGRAWRHAMAELVPGHTDAFTKFCLYNVDLGATNHRLRMYGESPQLKEILEKYDPELLGGNSPRGIEAIEDEFASLQKACDELLPLAGTNALIAEIKPWIEAAKVLSQRMFAATDMYKSLIGGDNDKFIDSYLSYCKLTDQGKAIASRDFEGSIKVAHPVVGTLVAEPFLRRSVSKMTDIYKSVSNHRVDMLPNLPIENGKYVVKVNGKFLGNPLSGTDKARPMLEDKADDVNPDRQIWQFEYNPEMSAYKISNAKDGLAIGVGGEFVADYDPGLHTFVATKSDDKFLFKGKFYDYPSFFVVDGDVIKRDENADLQAVFELIPVQ